MEFRIDMLLLTIAVLVAIGCASGPATGVEPEPENQRLYFLPWEPGTSHRCVQTGPGPFSHKGRSRFAVDFAMAEGTPVLAARGGEVVGVKEDSDEGGWSREYAKNGNYVRILHEDGTRAKYLHLRQGGAAVEVGDRVARGDIIAYSGDTGWSAFPHLHFQVDRVNPETKLWESVPFAFVDVAGDGKPRLLGLYVSGNR